MILPDVLSRMHVSSRMRARSNKLIVKLGLTEVPVSKRLILPRLLVRGTSRPTWPHTYGCGELHLPSQDILCTNRSIYPALVSPEGRPSTSGGDEPQPKPPVTLAPALLSQPRGNLPGPAPHVYGIYAPESGCPAHSARIRPYPPPSCWRLNLGTKWSSRLS